MRPSLARPTEYADVNVRGTAAVLEAAVRRGRPRVVFASSSSVYGEREDGPFRETDPVERPISPYAATKREAAHDPFHKRLVFASMTDEDVQSRLGPGGGRAHLLDPSPFTRLISSVT